jgi:hypothetical protein
VTRFTSVLSAFTKIRQSEREKALAVVDVSTLSATSCPVAVVMVMLGAPA